MSLGVVLFLLPNQLSSGGFSGIATLLYYLFDFKVGSVTLLLNLPLFIIAYLKLGKRFFGKAVIGTVVLSLLLNFFEEIFQNMTVITEDKLLASIYGGITVGIRKCNYIKDRRINRWNRTCRSYNIKNVSQF